MEDHKKEYIIVEESGPMIGRYVINGRKVRIVDNRGWGDKLEDFLHSGLKGKALKMVGIERGKCGGCKKRKEALNKLAKKEKS